MNKSEFISAVSEILEITAEGITGPEFLTEIGNWDSLALISFVAMVDTEFNKMVDPQKLKQAKTIDDLAALVEL